MARHVAQLPGAHPCVVTRQDQRLVVAVLLFAALVIGVGKSTDGGSDKSNRRREREETCSTGPGSSAKLRNCANTTPPIPGLQGVGQLHDVFLSLAGAELQLVESASGFSQPRPVLPDFSQSLVVALSVELTSFMQVVERLLLSLKLRQLGSHRINTVDGTLQRLNLAIFRFNQLLLLRQLFGFCLFNLVVGLSQLILVLRLLFDGDQAALAGALQ